MLDHLVHFEPEVTTRDGLEKPRGKKKPRVFSPGLKMATGNHQGEANACTLAEKECTLSPTRKQLKRIPTHVRSLGAF